MKRSPLVRRTPMRRKGALKRGHPARRGHNPDRAWQQARRWCLARAGHRCEADLGEGRCTERATEAHHIKLRSRGGSDGDENLMALCSHHHRWAHANPALATELGMMRPSWEQ